MYGGGGGGGKGGGGCTTPVFIDGHLQSRILLSSVDREKAECVAIAPVSSVSSFVWRPPL